ncbi:MAG: hydroxylamine reductase [Bacteriovoracaceae bacterium]|nr:hydroxylamine reductase [Bacteriovoracaceae bacterium]
MFCNQCEQAHHGVGCDKIAICGKPEPIADLFDLILYQTKGISWLNNKARENGKKDQKIDRFIIESLFLTVTNVNFDEKRVLAWTKTADEYLGKAADLAGIDRTAGDIPHAAALSVKGMSDAELLAESKKYPITDFNENEDIQSLMQLLTYGLKGLAAYAEHAAVLGSTDDMVNDYISSSFSSLLEKDLTVDELVGLNMKCGEVNIRCMEMLNEAHISHFGTPEPTEVLAGAKKGPAIVVSGHDLFMLEKLLEQTDKTDVNVYTHGEMLPAHGYPKLKEHKSLAGHFGTAWQNQQKEFDGQPAAFIFNTNCIQEPKKSYMDRVYTTSVVGWPGSTNIDDHDYSQVIEKAKALGGYDSDLPTTKLMTGFGHDAILNVADKIIAGVKSGDIKHFFLVGGCDGAKPGRNYFTDFVEQSPKDTVTMTLACGKFRFNHLQEEMGDIGGIPRLLDVGQCNDAYSAVRVATALADAFECGVNDLPLSMVISWYEQKAVVVLLSLLHLGIKGIRLGPTLPAFITPNILDFLVQNFDIKPIGNSAKADLEEILG